MPAFTKTCASCTGAEWCEDIPDTCSMDSNAVPILILLQGDDIDLTVCGDCGNPARDWPRDARLHPASRPSVMYQAEIYCADCWPVAFDDNADTPTAVYTLTDGPLPSPYEQARRARTEGQDRGKFDRAFGTPFDWLDYAAVIREMEARAGVELDPTCWQDFAQGYEKGFLGK